jgi:NAD(P)-dependent dehydrogenase (short-subunit alcohol dehydrogenase family)
VYAVDVDQTRLEQMYASSSSTTSSSPLVEAVVADLTDTAACDALLARVARGVQQQQQGEGEEEGVAVLVNCAGFMLPLPVLGADWELVEKQVGI